MCGFVGMVACPGHEVDGEVLRRMGRTLIHRGPDGEGESIVDGVGLFHRRLAIIDVRGGAQPMAADDVVLAYNGEIYNYLELRNQLRSRGHGFTTQSDTEVLLRSYLEHGLDCLLELNGMFAFALHDRRRGRLIAARDHFGIKPLYYCVTESAVLLASEIKALLAHPQVRPRVDECALQDYLTFQYVHGQRTLFAGIHELPPGHHLTVDLVTGALTLARYWDLSFPVDTHHTEEYFVERLRWLLEDTVTQQLRSDVPLGSYLSGGTDSSLVTILAARHYPDQMQCFTGAFPEGPEFDESPYAREVAETCGARLTLVHPSQEEFIDLLPRLIYHMDQPAAGPGLFPQYIVSRLAAQNVRVCLGGQGGDEIFGGYARYVVAYLEQALKGAIFETNEEDEHIVSLASILPNLPYLKSYVPMLRRFWHEELFEPMNRRYFRLIDRSEGSLDLFSADFRARYDREAVFARFAEIFDHPDTRSYINKMTHYDLVTGLRSLLQVEDRVSMAVSLESRVPLLDRRIAELIASMPPALRFKGGEMKYVLKRAAGSLLPPRILARKEKMGFPVPLHLWMRGRAGDFFRDVLLSQACRERGLYDMAVIESLLDREEPFGRRLWGLLNLELWQRQFIDAA